MANSKVFSNIEEKWVQTPKQVNKNNVYQSDVHKFWNPDSFPQKNAFQ